MRVSTLATLFACALARADAQTPKVHDAEASIFQVHRGPRLVEALLVDVDASGDVGVGDHVLLVMDRSVTLVDPLGVAIDLPVDGDSLGVPYVVQPGPDARTLQVVLGRGASLQSRQTFAPGVVAAGFPSGVALGLSTAAGALVAASDGAEAALGVAVDLRSWFAAAPFSGFGTATHRTHAADLDGNGTVDVLVEATSGALATFLNPGDAAFVPLASPVGSGDAQCVALGDVDGDGDLDLAEGRPTTKDTELWWNDGAGAFAQTVPGFGANDTRALQLVDVDGDGDLDLIAGNYAQGDRIWIQESDVAFHAPGPALGAGRTRALVARDFDRDGDVDFVAGHEGEPNVLWSNDGFGGYVGLPLIDPAAPWSTTDLAAADLDLDGDEDLIEAGEGSQGIAWWENDGAGGLAFAWTASSGQSLGRALAIADLDGDGDQDVVEDDYATPGAIWWNDAGALRLAALALPMTVGNGLSVARLDGDGSLDLLLGSSFGPDAILLGSAQAGWGGTTFVDSGQVFPPRPAWDLALADFDGDGAQDMVVAHQGFPAELYLNAGAGVIALAAGFGPGTGETRAVAAGDLDGDGEPDFVTGDRTSVPSTRVYRHLDGAQFATAQTFGADETFALALSDLDGDGDLDLISGLASTLRVRTNGGAGTFSGNGTDFGVDQVLGIGLADVDLDGDVDLVGVCPEDSGVPPGARLWENLGGAFFADSGQDFGSVPYHEVALGDLDGDGDADLVLGRSNNKPDSVWRNVGGTFHDTGQVFPIGNTAGLVLRDLDGDADLDLAVARTHQPTQVWRNVGAAAFEDTGAALGSFPTQAIGAADLDQDGDVDLLTVNHGTSQRIYTNE